MTTKRAPRPRDPIALAKLISDIATDRVVDDVEDGKDGAAASMGRRGGAARAATMTDEARAVAAGKPP
jgi:hypothetical protein